MNAPRPPADRGDEALLQTERSRMAAAFDGVIDEPVPDRLTALLTPPPKAPVVHLDTVRPRARRLPNWAAWGGMAATLVLGTWLGAHVPMPGSSSAQTTELAASGAVAQALETRLASEGHGAVAVQISFKARDGRFCRTFTTPDQAGLACRGDDGRWALQQLVAAPPAHAASGSLRQAATALPPAVLAAVDAAIADGPLNALQERTARDGGWRR